MTRQGAAELLRQIHAAPQVTGRVVLIESEARDRGELDNWFLALKLHVDWIMRIEFESVDGDLQSLL
jgi:hypothetical protein